LLSVRAHYLALDLVEWNNWNSIDKRSERRQVWLGNYVRPRREDLRELYERRPERSECGYERSSTTRMECFRPLQRFPEKDPACEITPDRNCERKQPPKDYDGTKVLQVALSAGLLRLEMTS
jgi:hypothetical protein